MEVDAPTPLGCILAHMDTLFSGNEAEFAAAPSRLLERLRTDFHEGITASGISNSSWPTVRSPTVATSLQKAPVMVRARAMVQDALGTEFFAASCELTHGEATDSPSTSLACGFLRDSFDNATVTAAREHGTRHCYVMVPVPGTTAWFERLFDGASGDEKNDVNDEKMDETTAKIVDKFVAKFLDEAASELKANAVFDIYGVLSTHAWGVPEGAEEDAASPESSETNLVGIPNFHVLHYSKVDAVPKGLPPPPSMSDAMGRLRELLEQCVGDQTAAIYLLANFISTTYSRATEHPICAFPLNVAGCRSQSSPAAAEGIREIMEILLPKVKYLPLSSSSLSDRPFHSLKDFSKSTQLQMGEFQLSDGTHLVIDETTTPTDKFAVHGYAEDNLRTLDKVIGEQRIDYDFGCYRLTFDVDVPVLVLSEGRSRFVATPFRVVLPHGPSPTADPLKAVDEKELAVLRAAILHARAALRDVTISGEVAKAIQDDFVSMAASPVSAMTPDAKASHLSQLLIVCRLATVLRGERDMSIDAWKQTVAMEKLREKEHNERFPAAQPNDNKEN